MHQYVLVGCRGFALVDPEDYDIVMKHRWYYSGAYAINKDGVLMHRLILGLGKGDPRQVQHINGHKTDNQKKNLYVSPGTINLYTKRDYNVRSYVGVKTFYLVYFSFWTDEDGKTKHGGPWFTVERAAWHYDIMQMDVGKPAINFPEITEEAVQKIVSDNQAALTQYYGRRVESGHTGVSWRKNRQHWEARVRHNGKVVYLGSYKAEGDAARAYDNYVIQHNLQRKLNFPGLLLTCSPAVV